ncbi:hypothetical protein SAMN05421677_1437 [Halobacillus aidingensis]|uniref:Uncharacterized protein n=1 Tax=Halobacillus aidingensis TaxID=240303 RepID=A0A1H0VUE9_HALAD|nr:hypothetical protein SAMN05421677_1437 [Halobacillus aidingensis]
MYLIYVHHLKITLNHRCVSLSQLQLSQNQVLNKRGRATSSAINAFQRERQEVYFIKFQLYNGGWE